MSASISAFLSIILTLYVPITADIASLPFSQTWSSQSVLSSYSIMNPVTLTTTNNELSATFTTETVWWKDQMNALFIYQNISLSQYPSFAITTITKARSKNDLSNPILSGYHYGGPMIRIPSTTENNFVFVAIGSSDDCNSQSTPCIEDKSTVNNQPTIDKTAVRWTTNAGDAQLRICKYGNTFKAYSRSNNNANENWYEDGSWDRADMSGQTELQIGIMGFSFYTGSGATYYWGDMVIETISSFNDCLNNAFNTGSNTGSGTTVTPTTTVMSTHVSTTKASTSSTVGSSTELMDTTSTTGPVTTTTATKTEVTTTTTATTTDTISTTTHDNGGSSTELSESTSTTDAAATMHKDVTTTNHNSGTSAGTTTSAKSTGAVCVVGDIIYSDGDTVGVVGTACSLNSGTSYRGIKSTCINGSVVDSAHNGNCDAEYSGSKCCQSGKDWSYGGAVCINSTTECVKYVATSNNGKRIGIGIGYIIIIVMFII